MTKFRVTEQARCCLSVAEVAARTGLSRQFVRQQIRLGRLKAKKVSRRVLVPIAAETEWLAAAPDVTPSHSSDAK